MKKRIGKKMILILIFLIIIMILFKSYILASSFTFSVNATKTRLKPGEKTIVIMKISDIIDVKDLGINAVESTLEYDSNVLEVITPNDMKGKNNWTITYNAKQGNFLVHNVISGIKETQEIGEIEFKVKENVAKKTKTIIKFKNVKSNDGSKLMYEKDREVELIIDWDEIEKNNQTENIIQIETKEEKKADGIIPKTGENTEILVIETVILGIIGIISYIKFKNI